jgi:hypothetical protein
MPKVPQPVTDDVIKVRQARPSHGESSSTGAGGGAQAGQSMHQAALERQRKALKRQANAREHQELAERRAADESDPESREAYLAEARMHARAARLHESAAEVQARHALAHPDPPPPGDDE